MNFKDNEIKHPSHLALLGFEPRCYIYVANCAIRYGMEVSLFFKDWHASFIK